MDGSDTGVAQGCPLDQLLRLLGAQWTPHLLWVLSREGPTRFGALRRRLDGISSKVLTERLRSLEAEGIVYREHVATIPPRVTYGLTPKGRELADVLSGLDRVAARWHMPDAARVREAAG